MQEILKDFKGVLVSDFYAAYDSIDCPQQKCLIHLMRDLNDDMLKNPYDDELRQIVQQFGDLLRPIIDTVDRRGLKKHFLDLSPNLRQTVKSQNSMNGDFSWVWLDENSHGN